MKEILLTRGLVAQVDDDDYDFLNRWRWCCLPCDKSCYAQRTTWEGGKRKTILMHRMILKAPDGVDVDHKDGNGLNNTRRNIRLCSRMQNMQNMKNFHSTTSKYKGVRWEKERNKWVAKIVVAGKHIHLGCFTHEEKAALAYNWAATRYFGEFARLNNVGES